MRVGFEGNSNNKATNALAAALAAKERQASPLFADPEGAAQGFAPFSAEPRRDRIRLHGFPTRRRALGHPLGSALTREGRFLLVTFLCGLSKKSNSPKVKAFGVEDERQSHWIPAFAWMTSKSNVHGSPLPRG